MVHYFGDTLTKLPFAFWEKIPVGITSIDDLKDHQFKTVCAQSGSIQEEITSRKFPFLEIKHLDTIQDLILDIKYNKSLAAVLEPNIMPSLLRKNKELKILDVELEKNEQVGGNGIMIRKNNANLIQQVEATIKAMKADGTINKLKNKWFDSE
jgi:arginine transport system substrate-binding protein